jgi:ATP-dependent DNA ligase
LFAPLGATVNLTSSASCYSVATEQPALPGPACRRQPKHDGFRILAGRDAAGVRLYSRNGHDFSKRFWRLRCGLSASLCDAMDDEVHRVVTGDALLLEEMRGRALTFGEDVCHVQF